MGTLIQDLRFGLRMLAKNPGFTAVAVITLALGIGANTAIFSVVNAVLLRPLPYREPSRLVLIMEKVPLITREAIPLPAPDVVEFQRENRSFQYVGGFQSIRLELSGASQPQRLSVARVSAALFPLLGVSPLLGRTFSNHEDHPGRLVAVLSYGLWQRRFGGDPNVLGKSITLDRETYTVIGVMPRSFKFPLEGLLGGDPAALWVPMAFTPQELADVGDDFDYGAVARLKPGATMAQAEADVASIGRHILEGYPASMRGQIQLSAVALPLRPLVVGRAKPLVLILLVAVGLVLLIACVNVANLLLARGANRQKEVAIRSALGAGHARLFRQFASESILLGITGGAAGLLVAGWSTRLLISLMPVSMPHVGGFGMDLHVLAFTAALSVFTAAVFGLVPALAATRTPLNETLKESGRTPLQGHRHRRLRGLLVVAETALALTLVTAAGLLVRSFVRLLKTSTGFDPQHVLTLTLDLPAAKYQTGPEVASLYRNLLDRLSNLPGVRNVGAATSLPIVNTNWNHLFSVEDHKETPGEKIPLCWHALVLGDYFQSLHIPLIRGRFFNSGDRPGTLPVVIVSKTIADHYWPGQDPIGKRLKWGPPQSNSRWLTVVGVVGDVKQKELTEQDSFHTYQPYLQVPQYWTNGLGRSMSFALRTSLSPGTLAGAARVAVWSLDRNLAISHLETLQQGVSKSMAPQRFNLFLMTAFAALAVLLACIGIYGVISFSVAQRTHEIGIRMAIGANQSDVLRLIVGEGMKLVLVGISLGLVGSLVATRFLATLLYGIKPHDILTFVTAPIVLGLVALTACYVPARRATKVDPMVALRNE